MAHGLALKDTLGELGFLIAFLDGDKQGMWLADDFVRGVAEDLLGAGVPGKNGAVE